MDILTNLDMKNAARIQNLPNAITNQEPATLGQLNSLVEGISWKPSVRVSTSSNVSIASPGATLDGVTMATGDRVLVRGQTTASQNGIYIWNGSAVPMTRSADANSARELESATASVEEGTSAGSTYRQTVVNFVLETDAVSFTGFGTVSPPASESTSGIAEIATQAETDAGTDDLRIVTPLKFKNSTLAIKRAQGTIGDGAATQFDITHNIGTLDVIVQIVTVATGKEVIADVTRLSTTVVRINFASAPTAGQYRVVILG